MQHSLATMTSAFLLGALCLLAMPAGVDAEQPDREDAEPSGALQALVQEGLQNNQELAALRREVAALEREAPAAGAFSDPKLGFAMLNLPTDTFALDQEPMTQKQVSLTQRLQWFGKLSLAERKVLLRAEGRRRELQRRETLLARDIAVAYHELGVVYEGLETNQKLRTMLDMILRVAESRYATGSGSQQDILQAQVEMNQLLDERIVLKKRLRQGRDRINELLQRESVTDIAPHAPPLLELPPLEQEALQEAVLEENPEILLRQAELAVAEVDVELARKEFMPDMDLTVAYGQRDDDPLGRQRADFLSAGVSFTIPLWASQKQGQRLEAARERLEAARHGVQSVRRKLPHQVDALLADIDSLKENHRLLKEVLSLQAAQWADASLAAYEVGDVDFDAMLTAELRLLRFDLKLRTYRHELHAVLARLDALSGGALAEAPARIQPAQPRKQTPAAAELVWLGPAAVAHVHSQGGGLAYRLAQKQPKESQ